MNFKNITNTSAHRHQVHMYQFKIGPRNNHTSINIPIIENLMKN